jgi:cytochrome c-type biogenesis protein CcmH/NrfF
MKKETAERLARGDTQEAILEGFRARYGEKVLSSPTFRGFNWLAWIMPFAAVLVSGFVLAVVIRRWTRSVPEPAAIPTAPPADDPLRQRLARELEQLDRER